jgi:hypothetical protein
LFTALNRAQICGDEIVTGSVQFVDASGHAHNLGATGCQQIGCSQPYAATAARYQRNSSFNATHYRKPPL